MGQAGGGSFEFRHGPRHYPLPWGHRGASVLGAQTSMRDIQERTPPGPLKETAAEIGAGQLLVEAAESIRCQLQEKYPFFPYNVREAMGLIRREMSRLQHSDEMIQKATRAVLAKNPEGRANYAIDLFADELLQGPVLDEFLHALLEIGLSKGPLDRRVKRSVRKTAKHRLGHH